MNYSSQVLIIDDEASLRQTMARILQREGYHVTTAENGTEGLALLSQNDFDLVYLDIRMPELSGLEVLKTIRAQQPQLPVILFTAQPDVTTAIQALRNGATDYLLKPLKPAQLIEHTKAILARQEDERLKRELQVQIKSLEAKLRDLENVQEPKQTPGDTANEGDHYLKRGKLTLDLHRYRAIIANRVIDLPLTAFNYLLVLARHAPGIVSYQTLVAEAQGYQASAKESQEITKWHIHQIRQAIEKNARHPSFIINVRGTGYRLVVD